MEIDPVMISRASVIPAMLLLGGCMVGPKYSKPTTPIAPVFKEAPPASFKEGDGWKTAQPNDQALRGDWWTMFQDAQLNALETQIEAANQTLRAADANYRAARAAVMFARAGQKPTITTQPGIEAVRSTIGRLSDGEVIRSGPGSFTLPVDFNWEIDLWGRLRRAVTSASELAEASAGDLENARLSLHAELAIDYFELRSADAQEKLLDETITAYTRALQLTQDRYEGGAAPKSDVTQARTQLDTARVQRTDVEVERAQFEHAIAILTGKPPSELSLPPAPVTAQPPAMPDIPGAVPSQLLERRPDIAAEERRMASANEQIGIAQAAYYPTINLGALGGFSGGSLLGWFAWPNRVWAVGPTLTETLFDGGRRRANSAIAIANYDAAIANYRQTALTAFQQVEDNLAALRVLEIESQQQRQATASAQESLTLFQTRYEGGVDTYLQVVTWQTAALLNERADIDLMRRRLDASVLLIKALGGGWHA
jgi:NodT family efflux transporter outer membrane factor (OMF) lipoprotein